jgi:hypothetical protein
VIGHYYEGVQIRLVEFGIAELEALADAFGDGSVFEPQRICLRAVAVLVGMCKFLACGLGFFSAEYSQDASR